MQYHKSPQELLFPGYEEALREKCEKLFPGKNIFRFEWRRLYEDDDIPDGQFEFRLNCHALTAYFVLPNDEDVRVYCGGLRTPDWYPY